MKIEVTFGVCVYMYHKWWRMIAVLTTISQNPETILPWWGLIQSPVNFILPPTNYQFSTLYFIFSCCIYDFSLYCNQPIYTSSQVSLQFIYLKSCQPHWQLLHVIDQTIQMMSSPRSFKFLNLTPSCQYSWQIYFCPFLWILKK